MAIEFKTTEAIYRLPTGEYVGTVDREGVPVTVIIHMLDNDYKLVADWAADNSVVIIKGYPPKPSYTKTFDDLKAEKKAEIEKTANAHIAAGAEVGGIHYPASGEAVSHMMFCALESQLMPDDTVTYTVKTVDGDIMELDASELKNVVFSVNSVVSFAMSRKDECFTEIDNATTEAELNEVKFYEIDAGDINNED